LGVVGKGSRAVSLPPNSEFVHSRPVDGEDTGHDRRGPGIELPRIKVESGLESPLEKRAPGDGLPQFQPYWYHHLSLDEWC
jgi:hypothetical protein